MARVIMEQTFETPLSDEEYARLAARLDECLEVRNGAWVRSYYSKDKKRCICEFEAPDAESVRTALRSAKAPFDRVWSADLYVAEDYPEHAARLAKVREKLTPR
jgi:Nickel responsive protein SCO4226-like